MGCPSNPLLDRLLAGELTGPEAADVEGHLSVCVHCRTLLSEIRRSREGPSPAYELVPSARAPHTWRRWALVLIAGMAALAALASWLRRSSETARATDRSGTQSKGSARVTLYIEGGGGIRLAAEGEHLLPGDAIGFAYSTDRPRYLAIVSVDRAGHTSVYYARDGRAVRVEAAQDERVSQSPLGGGVGEETIDALFCDSPVEIDPIVRALHSSPRTPPTAPGCAVERHAIFNASP